MFWFNNLSGIASDIKLAISRKRKMQITNISAILTTELVDFVNPLCQDSNVTHFFDVQAAGG